MTAETKPTVVEALTAVMLDVQAVGKDQRVNEGPVRFNFRGVDAVVQAVGPAFRKHRVVFAPSRVVSVEHERYQTAKGSLMDGVTVVVEYTVHGPAGDTLTVAAAGQAADSGDKAVSKAMSVSYRTALLQALCIPTDEPDPDSTVHERVPEPVRRAPDPLHDLKTEVWEMQKKLGIVDPVLKTTAENLAAAQADYETRNPGEQLGDADEYKLLAYHADLVDDFRQMSQTPAGLPL